MQPELWERDIDNLEARFVLLDRNNPIPSPRDVYLYVWRQMTPIVKQHIRDRFVEKKKLQKIIKDLLSKA